MKPMKVPGADSGAAANMVKATPLVATTLTPYHHHTLATPSGTATDPRFLPDRAMSYALAGAMGALAASPALFPKDYARDLQALPWLVSVLEADESRLLPPLGRRLNIEYEGGHSRAIQNATATGNLKTWFFIQEAAPDLAYRGAVFGADPFEMASEASGENLDTIVVRTGRHLGGLVALRRDDSAVSAFVRLNAHTAHLFGDDPNTDHDLAVDEYVLYDLQYSKPLELSRAATIVARWRPDLVA